MDRTGKIFNDFFFNSCSKFLDRYTLIKLICLFAIGNAFLISPDILEIFSGNGLISSEINNQFLQFYQPRIGWFSDFFGNIGITENILVMSIFLLYVISLIMILLKKNIVMFAIMACSIKMILINSSYLFSYGADSFILFILFINIFLNISMKLSQEKGDILFSFTGRFVQIQLCIIYFFAGFGKILGNDWLDGNAVWYIMNTYAFDYMVFFKNAAEYPVIFQILSWIILIELLYPILVLFKTTRKPTLFIIIGLHIGIIMIMQFYTFGLVMILLNIIGFGTTISKKQVKTYEVLKT